MAFRQTTGLLRNRLVSLSYRRCAMTTGNVADWSDNLIEVGVDVIVPMHNAASTIKETLLSALRQVDLGGDAGPLLKVYVCCYDDGSTDGSWDIVSQLFKEHEQQKQTDQRNASGVPFLGSQLLLGKSESGVSRGAGFARNRAVGLRKEPASEREHRYLCMLDSDDVMQPTRIAEQIRLFLSIPDLKVRERTLLGTTFERDPPDSTWHYAQWANQLTDERLVLEKFRECTLIQPTWMISRSWFKRLGGYVEAPIAQDTEFSISKFAEAIAKKNPYDVVDPSYETADTLRVAEDTRFFYKHLEAGGHLRLLKSDKPLLMYRHRKGQSQSSQTSRKLLWHLRVRAFERMILGQTKNDSAWPRFCVWGAGRDGKDFVKALRPEFRDRIACMVDVDEKKISIGYYHHKELGARIPVVHFSLLARDESLRNQLRTSFELGVDVDQPGFGRVRKSKDPVANQEQEPAEAPPPKKRRKVCCANNFDCSILPTLPVVICVAMYRTGGALEHNVKSIGRTEGVDLWHFS